ncbi:AAA family ATPase [Streptosporangium sp. NBC_01639]|uniref:helix-turn-helix transcriptional regulator n=1 Tax=Streptosporangium sp. NBC_01639 TaxID=2975948 RepID=UPI0038641CDE|nr:AAA family ATPase [Streptosporangium sp. NBC_01639]
MGLVERDEALASLEGLLTSAVTGKGRAVLISGTVASGKSELLHSFAEQAIELGALPITATGSRVERDLPMGVLGQLIHDAPLVAEERDRALALLEEGARTVMSGDPRAETLEPVDAQVVHALCTVLLELSERYPLLVVVDDIHLADRASQLCLAYLLRRLRFARIAAVFSHSDNGRYVETFLETELMRQPHCRRVQLALLSEEGVATLAAERVGKEPAARFAAEWHGLSGGNPLLVGALIEDYQDFVRASGESPAEPVVGDRYGQAVVSCLQRGEPQTLQVARGLAVLGDPAMLDRLLAGGAAHVSQALHSLTLTGLLRVGCFRHEVARAAVLGDVDVDRRMDLHRRAAELAHESGASPEVIADHLLEGSRIEAPWVVPLLEDAARLVLREGRVDSAVAYLRLAWRECADEQQRMKITTTLMRAEWRINPGAPAGHLADLTDGLQRGSLRGSDAIVLAQALLWHGRFDDAREVLEYLKESGNDGDLETGTELLIARPWLRCTYPPFHAHLRRTLGEKPRPVIASVAADRRLEATLALAGVLVGERNGRLVETAERILRECHLDEMSMGTVESALLALTYGGWSEQAAPWCDFFMAEAGMRHAPSRQARLAAIRAEIALRQGDMPGAEHHARTALEIIPMSSWGVAVGGPLSSLIIAATAMGKHDVVHEHLSHPVPEAIFQSRYGLHYLYARGRYNLATDYPGPALRDFRLCGELMSTWGIDAPGLVPWRVDAAEACLRLGQPEQARRFAEDQLKRCGPATPRVHGMAMRLFAATGEVRHRPMLLRQAADLLQAGGDRYEMAKTLCDLAAAYQELGEFRRARMISSRAEAVAQECQADPLTRVLSRNGDSGGEVVAALSETEGLAAVLSDAERRVAILAASDYTNREIAGKLYLTVSTVEQHLTRTYRKLNITRRADLPSSLDLGGSRSQLNRVDP